MSAQVIDVFEHENNALDVARQEYHMAKQHFREVMQYRDCTNAEHQRRFRDALERQTAARERYIELLCR
jgi:GrpB-like predicted nucleotidyltransferase (UPF0157 family)